MGAKYGGNGLYNFLAAIPKTEYITCYAKRLGSNLGRFEHGSLYYLVVDIRRREQPLVVSPALIQYPNWETFYSEWGVISKRKINAIIKKRKAEIKKKEEEERERVRKRLPRIKI